VYRGRSAKVGDVAGTLRSNYLSICIRDGKTFHYRAHRIAWALYYGEDPYGFEIDHINRNKLDNRILNLRKVTKSQNLLNRKRKDSVVSGVKSNGKGGWTVTLKRRYIGSSTDYEKAVEMRLEAEKADQDEEYLCTSLL
jgi:hypothetical protein